MRGASYAACQTLIRIELSGATDLGGSTYKLQGLHCNACVERKRRIWCACLDAVFKLPMSTVTIAEDFGVVAMAVWMIAIVA
jgi:hypothetical protein